jgi:hypothetical protein
VTIAGGGEADADLGLGERSVLGVLLVAAGGDGGGCDDGDALLSSRVAAASLSSDRLDWALDMSADQVRAGASNSVYYSSLQK